MVCSRQHEEGQDTDSGGRECRCHAVQGWPAVRRPGAPPRILKHACVPSDVTLCLRKPLFIFRVSCRKEHCQEGHIFFSLILEIMLTGIIHFPIFS